MKTRSGRLIAQLALTALATPLLLLLLLVLHAFTLLALIAAPVVGLGRVVSDWMDGFMPPSGGQWLSGLTNAVIADSILVLLWVWAWLMILVKLLEKFVLRREKG